MSLRKEYKMFALEVFDERVSGYRGSMDVTTSYVLEEVELPYKISKDLESIEEYIEKEKMRNIVILPVYSYSYD